jgi:hypothetical protein
MSEVTEGAEVTPTSDKPARKSAKAVPFSSLHVTFAKAKGINTTNAGKANRGYMRANFDLLVKVWPELRASHKANRDGNRWPATVPANVAALIVKRDTAGLQALAKRKRG